MCLLAMPLIQKGQGGGWMNKPLCKFQIRISKISYVDCYIWDTVEQMRDATDHRFDDRDYDACWLAGEAGWSYSECGLTADYLGELHFSTEKIGAGIVAHELQHFICQWVDAEMGVREQFALGADDEEICLLAGNLTNQFWGEFYENFSVSESKE